MGLSGVPFLFFKPLKALVNLLFPNFAAMKKLVILAIAAMMVAGCAHKTMLIDTPAAIGQQSEASDNALIIFYDSEVGDSPVKATIADLKCDIVYEYANFKGLAIRLPEGLTIDKATKRLKATRGVLQVSRDYVNRLD